MKTTKLDSDTAPDQKYRQFQSGLRQVLTVSKEELMKREKQYQDARAGKPRRGPESSSASGHASSDGDYQLRPLKSLVSCFSSIG